MKTVLCTACLVFLVVMPVAHAKWIYNPETGLYNPKYGVKSTPEEQYKRAIEEFKKKDYDLSRKLFKRLIQWFPDSKYCPEAQFMIAECRFMEGNYYKAHREYQSLMKEYPKHERIQQVIEKEFQIGHLLCGGAKREWVAGIRVGAEDKGIEVLETVIRLDSWDDKADDALFEIGQCQLRRKQYDAAAEAFGRLVRDYPSSEHAKKAQYLKGMCSYAQIQGPEYDPTHAIAARKDFEVVKDEFPETDDAQEAKTRITQMQNESARSDYTTAIMYLKNYKYAAAVVYLRALSRKYPTTTFGQKAKRVLEALDTLEPEK